MTDKRDMKQVFGVNLFAYCLNENILRKIPIFASLINVKGSCQNKDQSCFCREDKISFTRWRKTKFKLKLIEMCVFLQLVKTDHVLLAKTSIYLTELFTDDTIHE